MNWFKSRKTKALESVKRGDTINIHAPKGFYVTIGNSDIIEYPIGVLVINNDPKSQKIFIRTLVDEQSRLFILKYSDPELDNFILLNRVQSINSKINKLTLEQQLKTAIDNNNFETAAIINEKLKNLTK